MNELRNHSGFSQSSNVPPNMANYGRTWDRNLANIVSRMLKSREIPGSSTWNANPAGVRDRALILSDRALSAYFFSVAEAGDAGWDEEMGRVRAALRPSLARMPPECRLGVSISGTVLRFLQTYRAWGRILLQAGAEEYVAAQAQLAQAAWERLW